MTWGDIKQSINSVFDSDKYMLSNGIFHLSFSSDTKFGIYSNRPGLLGEVSIIDDNYKIELSNSDTNHIDIPIDDFDELEFTLINGRPSFPYRTFNDIINLLLSSGNNRFISI